MLNPSVGRRVLAFVAGVVWVSLLRAAPPGPELMSPPTARAFVSGLVTWEDHGILAWYGGSKDANVVAMQRLDTALETYGRPVPITDLTHAAFEPSVARGERDLLVAWYERDPEAAVFNVQAALVDWSGRAKWHLPLTQPGRGGRNPVIRAAPDGAWVAWLQPEAGQAVGVWVVHLSMGGDALAPAQRAGTADRDTAHLNAAVDADGRFYVVFDARLDSRARELQLVTVDALSAHQRVWTSDDGAASTFPDIAIEGDRVAVCWVDIRDGRGMVNAAVVARTRIETQLDAAAVSLTSARAQVGGSYLAWNHGRLAVAWNETGPTAGIYLQQIDARGRPASKVLRLAQTTAPARAAVPALAAWRRGFAVAWNEYTEDEGAQRVLGSTALRTIVP